MECIKCNLEKELNINNFYWRNDSQKWIRTCKKCTLLSSKKRYSLKSQEIKKKAANYRNSNRDIINNKAASYNMLKETKARATKWRLENKKWLRKKEREWKLKNPEKYREIVRRKSKKQRAKPANKIKAHVSRQINFALHRTGNSKMGNAVLKFLSYSIQELKNHLESQFEPWMNWSNYGKISVDKKTWNIDHIIPQSDLPYQSMTDDNFKKCWSLENLRPLDSKINIIEGSTRARHK